ncbi:hypothetical protein YM80_003692 [Salmonella enterica subsp. salamae]|nr:hypothetical protein [Salmonella enterica subsp. salamae]
MKTDITDDSKVSRLSVATQTIDIPKLQAITDWATNHSENDYVGVTYASRHYSSAGTCTAFWRSEGKDGPLVSPVDSYVDSDKRNWQEEDITGFEIVTQTLRFNVSKDGKK